MKEFVVNAQIKMKVKENETYEQARDRLYDLMYQGLCNTTKHDVDWIWFREAMGEDIAEEMMY